MRWLSSVNQLSFLFLHVMSHCSLWQLQPQRITLEKLIADASLARTEMRSERAFDVASQITIKTEMRAHASHFTIKTVTSIALVRLRLLVEKQKKIGEQCHHGLTAPLT
jgi:hypothetical protein